jgi:hypothetical protein
VQDSFCPALQEEDIHAGAHRTANLILDQPARPEFGSNLRDGTNAFERNAFL